MIHYFNTRGDKYCIHDKEIHDVEYIDEEHAIAIHAVSGDLFRVKLIHGTWMLHHDAEPSIVEYIGGNVYYYYFKDGVNVEFDVLGIDNETKLILTLKYTKSRPNMGYIRYS